MNQDVLVTISGRRLMGMDNEDIELVTPGTYSVQDGWHVVQYEEPMEGINAGPMTENTILIGNGQMQILKKGFANVQMSFLNTSERVTSCYSTPFGDFLIGISTRDIAIEEERDRLRVSVDYALDIGDEHLSDCSINVEIASRTTGQSENAGA